MRIVQLVTRMDVLGGAQTHVSDLTKGLRLHGHEVILISHGEGPLTKELQALSITYEHIQTLGVPIQPWKDLQAYRQLIKLLKKYKPDLLAIHSSKAGILGRMAGWRLGIPTIFTAHSWSFSGLEPGLKRNCYIGMEKLAGALSSGIITVSHHNYREAEKAKIAQKPRMHVIHNGIHDDEWLSAAHTGVRKLELIMVARFAHPKNHPLFFQALQELTHLPWHLTLIGDGPLLPEMKSYVTQCGWQHRVHFTGEIKEVAEYLQRAHLFVLVSSSEGLPISIIEAMRAGLPVIASDVGGISELVDEGETGYVVEKNDVTALITALETLITKEEQRIRFGNNARQKYVEDFTFEKMLKDTVHYYEQVMLKEQIKKQGVLEG